MTHLILPALALAAWATTAEPAGDRRGYTLLKGYAARPASVARRPLEEVAAPLRAEALRSAFAYAAYHDDTNGVAALLGDQRLDAFDAVRAAYLEAVAACASPAVARLQVTAETLNPLYARELRRHAREPVRAALLAAQPKGRRFVRECERVNDLIQGQPPEQAVKVDLNRWYAVSRAAEPAISGDEAVLARRRDLINQARVRGGFLPFNDGWTPGASR